MEKKNEIVYDEGFARPSKTVIQKDEEEPIPVDEQEKPKEPNGFKPLLISVQLLFCLLSALLLFLLKSMGSDLYDRFEAWYNEEMNKPLISQSMFDQADLSAFLSPASVDEVAPERN